MGDIEILEEHYLSAHFEFQLGWGGAVLEGVRPRRVACVRCSIALPWRQREEMF
jgi:hypothetical protein